MSCKDHTETVLRMASKLGWSNALASLAIKAAVAVKAVKAA